MKTTHLVTILGATVLAGSLVAQIVAGCIPVVLLLATNAATTGDPFVFAYDALNGHAHRPGFHVDPMGELHTPRRGVFSHRSTPCTISLATSIP